MQKAGTARNFCSQNKILIDLYAVMQKNGNWLLWFERYHYTLACNLSKSRPIFKIILSSDSEVTCNKFVIKELSIL